VVSVEVLFELVPPRTGVVALRALERFVLEVDAFVAHQVTLFEKAPATGGTRVRPHAHVRPHVRTQLRSLRRRVPALWVRALVHFTCDKIMPKTYILGKTLSYTWEIKCFVKIIPSSTREIKKLSYF